MGDAFKSFQKKQAPRKLEVKIDHTKIVYEPFRKSFYVEVQLLGTKSFFQREGNGIRVSTGYPSQFFFLKSCLRFISSYSYTEFFSVLMTMILKKRRKRMRRRK